LRAVERARKGPPSTLLETHRWVTDVRPRQLHAIEKFQERDPIVKSSPPILREKGMLTTKLGEGDRKARARRSRKIG